MQSDHRGTHDTAVTIPGRLLKSGQYSITVNREKTPYVKVNFQVELVITFWVESADYGSERNRAGVVAPELRWVVQRTGSPESIVTVREER